MTTDELIRDLTSLVSPGAGRGTTLAGTQRPTSPKGWEPGVQFRPDGGMVVTTPPTRLNLQRDEDSWTRFVQDTMDLELPEGYVAILKEAKYDPAAWHRDTEFLEWPDAENRDGPTHTKAPAVTRPVWRYKFAIELASEQVHREDVDRIITEVMRKKRKRPTAPTVDVPRALNVVYADPQAGKVAILGGTEALANRVADCFDMLTDHLRDLRKIGRGPTEAAWFDGGDCIEGFSNARSQERTNDLQLTQQVRAHRRLTLHGLGFLADRFAHVNAYTCGSNHAQVRDGKDPVAGPDDDWGIEVLSQVQDAYALNPDTYGHVSFGYPHPFRDSLLAVSGGMPIGLVHGHQFKGGTDKAVADWWRGQTFGNQPVAEARILISNHYHHWASREMGDGRLWIQSPTLDNGSDWFTRISGEVSMPGLLVFSTTPDGWDDLRILRPTP